ncbi:unnamed protein product, partial [Polarella glacialis]
AAHPELLKFVRGELRDGIPVVATARTLPPLLDLLNALCEPLLQQAADMPGKAAFLGLNPFMSHWCPGFLSEGTSPCDGEASPGKRAQLLGLAARPELNGLEVLLAEKLQPKDGGSGVRWRVRLADGNELSVRAANLALEPERPWPPSPPPEGFFLSDAEIKQAARAQLLAESFEPRVAQLMISAAPGGANSFWLGLLPSPRK